MTTVIERILGRGTLVIDAHAHLWREEDAEIVVNEARRVGVSKIVVSCLVNWDWSAPGTEPRNSLVFDAAKRYPELYGYIYIDPLNNELAVQQLERYLDDPSLVGIKLWISCPANHPAVYALTERASKAHLPMLVHAWRRGTRLRKGYQTLPSQVAELASSFPKTFFLMAHMGGDWELGCREVAEAENVSVDTSGSINETGMLETAVDVLGAERVLFGTDAPSSGFLPNLGKVLSAEIEDEEKRLILGLNALKKLVRLRD